MIDSGLMENNIETIQSKVNRQVVNNVKRLFIRDRLDFFFVNFQERLYNDETREKQMIIISEK